MTSGRIICSLAVAASMTCGSVEPFRITKDAIPEIVIQEGLRPFVAKAEFNVMSSVLTTDIYRRIIRKNAGERETLLVARLATIGVAAFIAFGALFVSRLGGAFEANKLLMALFGVPIVIPSVFGILWKRPNTKGVYLCIAMGVLSGVLLKTCLKDLSWESGTFIQIAVCFAGFFGGALFGTAKREAESREWLFNVLLAAKNAEDAKNGNGRVERVETCRKREKE